MNAYFKYKNQKLKKKLKHKKTLTSVLEPVNTLVIIGATTTSVTLSFTGVLLIVVPIVAGNACVLSLGNKELPYI